MTADNDVRARLDPTAPDIQRLRDRLAGLGHAA